MINKPTKMLIALCVIAVAGVCITLLTVPFNTTDSVVVEENARYTEEDYASTDPDTSRDHEGDTFSIVAYDSNSGQIGGAGCSCVAFSGGIDFLSDLITDGTTNPDNIVGAIHTQAAYLATNQNNARARMLLGETPQQIVSWLDANDCCAGNANTRQYGVVGVDNPGTGPAGYTGSSNGNYANHVTGTNSGFSYSIQGNILDVPNGQDLLEDMEAAFNSASGDLADKIMAAMQAAKRVGGDNRCQSRGNSGRTAFIKMLNPGSNTPTIITTGTSVPDGIEPIDELQCLYDAANTPPTCRETVTSLPYTMDFEDFVWIKPESNCSPTSSTNSWIRSRFSTPTGGTGPSGANQGLLYMFVEADQGTNDSAIMESPCIDIPNGQSTYMTFDYHMSGANMGTLNLDLYDGSTWSTIWTRSGDQGASWLGALVELTPYAGTNIKLRFNGTTGAGVASDMALDNIEISNTPPPPVSCTNTVSAFPYAESFESGLGLWSQASGDDGDWRRYDQGTPSGNTGPSGASDGSWYLYTEASSNNTPNEIGSNATAILDGPCFDLTGASDADFTFDYHSWGSDTGSISLQVAEFDGLWVTEWSINGVNNNAWVPVTVNLSDYAGETIAMRFIGTTGGGFASDMAIDNLGMTITPASACSGTTRTWNGTTWSPSGTPTINDPVIINGAYDTSSDGDLTACSVTVNTGNTLRINTGGLLNVDNDIVVDGSLIVEHTGIVVQADDMATTTNNGTINVNITTPVLQTRDFMVMGSPMSADLRQGVYNSAFLVLQHTPATFIPHPDVPAGGTNFADDNNDFWTQFAAGPINVGEGYIVRPQSSFTDPANVAYNFTHSGGTLNNGDITRTIVFNGLGTNPDGTPNALANPYASPIDADDLISNNTLINEVYFWEHLTPPSNAIPGANGINFSMGDISMYNLSGGTEAANDPGITTRPNGTISTGQGFGIKAFGAGTVTFTNSMRRTSGNSTLRNSTSMDRIWLKLSNPEYNLKSSTLIAFSENNTAQAESGYDSPRLSTFVSLFSHLENGTERFGIQTREAFDNDLKVSMGFESQVDAMTTYEISIEEVQGVNVEGVSVYLIDNELGIITDLTADNYVFQSNKGTFDQRFTLAFEREVLSTEENTLNDIIVYPNPTRGLVTISSKGRDIESIEVFDINGRRVMNLQPLGEESYQFDLSALESSVYFVRISTPSGTRTQRIVRL